MFETVVVATDGSASVERAVETSVDLAARFDADVTALYVIDEREVESAPETVRAEVEAALTEQAQEAVDAVTDRAADRSVEATTAVREGRPATAIPAFAREVDADLVAVGTRGRHGENRFLVGSVAERVVESCPVPVLAVRTPGASTA